MKQQNKNSKKCKGVTKLRILNTWGSTQRKHIYFNVESKAIYRKGDYAIYKLGNQDYLYAYKNLAVAERTGVSKLLIKALATGSKFTGDGLMYYEIQRAIESKQLGLQLLGEQ